jgi:phage terminase large subunit
LSILSIPTARVFEPLLKPARYKGAWGGRGSGKSHFFGELLVDDHTRNPGLRSVCIREVQKSLKDSAKKLIEDKIQSLELGSYFEIQNDLIKTPGDGVILFQGMQDSTAESIKSLEGFNRAWVEEAQTLSQRSLALLRPTIRAEGSEIWASWNPRRKTDAIDEFLRTSKPDDAIVVKANWRDNPWFPGVLELERKLDLQRYPERYDHIWEGDYARAFEGAYFAKQLIAARQEGRIRDLPKDPMMPIRLFWDIGGSGDKSDAMAIWVVQWSGDMIRLVDYLEGSGQAISYYTNELRRRGYRNSLCYLPHDGARHDFVGKRFSDHLNDAEFETVVIPNQGPGAALLRIEALRRIFPRLLFDEKKTEVGRDALGFYHEKKDEQRNIGLGPEHDWSSHAADAAGLMAICYEGPDSPLKIDDLFDRSYADTTRSDITGY